ncbi:MAG TPA: response regulator transcription factor [Vicinamibacterales bacterium]|nr:response regulator transcription factor [Vicinamibacterales bacterium]
MAASKEGRRYRILVADDHAIVRQGLKLLIDSQPDMEVVAEAADGAAALDQAVATNPDIAILDISMPRTNGLQATKTMKQRQPGIRVIALTRHEDERYVEELLRAGASGYVLKQSAPADFLKAVRAVAAGGIYLDPSMTSRVADGLLGAHNQPVIDGAAKLTDRETEVLRLVAIGHSNVEIGAQLDISVKTVEVHKANAMRKLGLSGRVDVIRYGVLQGWLYDT